MDNEDDFFEEKRRWVCFKFDVEKAERRGLLGEREYLYRVPWICTAIFGLSLSPFPKFCDWISFSLLLSGLKLG